MRPSFWRACLSALVPTAGHSSQGRARGRDRAPGLLQGLSGPGGTVGSRGPRRPEVRRHVGRRPRAHPRGRRPRRPHAASGATTSSWSSRAMGKETDELLRLADEVSDAPARPRDGHADHRRRAQGHRPCCAWPSHELGVPAESFTGSQAGFITDTTHTNAKIVEVRPDRIREALDAGRVAGGRRRPGRVHRPRRHLPRPGRLRHHRGGPGPRPRRRRLRALHRRARACSPPTPGSCPRPAACDRISLRRDARDDAPTGCPKPAMRSVEFARNHGVRAARPLRVHLGAGHLGHRGGPRHGTGDHLGRRARPVRGQGHRQRACPTARASRPACSARWPTPTSTST